MNIIEYLEQLKIDLSNLTKEELINLFIQVAKGSSESIRFLINEKLNDINNSPVINENHLWSQELREKSKEVEKLIEKINNGDIYVETVEDMESYSYDWYDDGNIYLESTNFVKNLELIVDFLEEIFNKNYFYRAYKLGLEILNLKIHNLGDYGENSYNLFELYNEDVYFNFYKIALLTLEASFLKNRNNIDRSKSLYKVYSCPGVFQISLESIFQNLEIEINEFKLFLNCLINFLKKQNSSISIKLLNQAYELNGNKESYLKTALNRLNSEPDLFINYLKTEVKNPKTKFDLSLEALKQLKAPNKTGFYLVSQCLKTIESKTTPELNKKSEFYKPLLLDLFRFNPSIENFLFVYTHYGNYEKALQNLGEIINNLKPNESVKNELIFFELLLGNYDKVLEKINLKDLEIYPDSDNLTIIYLFMFLLYRKEYLNEALFGLEDLIYKNLFNSFPYLYRKSSNEFNLPREEFKNNLNLWRLRQNIISEETTQKILFLIKSVTLDLINQILKSQSRYNYSYAALLLTVYANLLYSLGKTQTVDEIIDKYRKPYKKYNKFLHELQDYGYQRRKNEYLSSK